MSKTKSKSDVILISEIELNASGVDIASDDDLLDLEEDEEKLINEDENEPKKKSW